MRENYTDKRSYFVEAFTFIIRKFFSPRVYNHFAVNHSLSDAKKEQRISLDELQTILEEVWNAMVLLGDIKLTSE